MNLTVADLINELKTLPADAEIAVQDGEGWYVNLTLSMITYSDLAGKVVWLG